MNSLVIKEDKLDIFKRIIAVASGLVNEVKFSFTPNSLEMVAFDNANISMCIFKFDKQFFDSSSVLTEESYFLNMSNLKTLLNRYKNTDLKMEFTDVIKFESITSKTKKKFNLRLLDSSEDKEKKIPNLEDGNIVKIDSLIFREMLDDVASITDNESSIHFCVKDNTMLFKSENTSLADFQSTTEGVNVVNTVSDKEAAYSLNYLQKMFIPNEEAEFNFKEAYPLRINYSGDNWKMTFVLAPRVENN